MLAVLSLTSLALLPYLRCDMGNGVTILDAVAIGMFLIALVGVTFAGMEATKTEDNSGGGTDASADDSTAEGRYNGHSEIWLLTVSSVICGLSLIYLCFRCRCM